MTMTVHVEMSHDLPLVSVTVGFRIGSQLDPLGKEGLTRLMARMLRRGAAGMGATAIESEIDRLGADFSEHVGASAVVLQLDVIRRSVEPAIEMLAKIIGEPDFDEGELGKLVRQTEGEIVETRDSDRLLCTRAFRRTLFRGHPFERRISGLLGTVNTIGRGDLVEQHRRMLTRDKAVVAFSGDVDGTVVEKAAQRIESALRPEPSPDRALAEPSPPQGRELVFVDKPERTQTQVLIGGLGTHAHDPDHVALLVANTVFGGMFTSRLMNEVRSKRGWSYGAYSHLPIDVCREAFSVWTHPAANDVGACIALELSLLESWRNRGITQKELVFAKRHLVRSHAFEVDTASKRVQRRVATSLYDLPADYYSAYLDRILSITREQANAAIGQRLSTDNVVVSVTGTHAQIGAAVAQAIPGLARQAVVPYDSE